MANWPQPPRVATTTGIPIITIKPTLNREFPTTTLCFWSSTFAPARAFVGRGPCAIDLVLPSLDAGDAFKFAFLNRPHADLTFEQMVEGLIAFRGEFTGQLWLEVFLLGGYTAIEADVKKIAAWVKRIRPDRVQLNTVARPPAEDFAVGVSADALRHFAQHFDPKAKVVVERVSRVSHKQGKSNSDAVLDLLRRRPCTVEQLATGLRLNQPEVIKWLEVLSERGEIEGSRHEGRLYYCAKAISEPEHGGCRNASVNGSVSTSEGTTERVEWVWGDRTTNDAWFPGRTR